MMQVFHAANLLSLHISQKTQPHCIECTTLFIKLMKQPWPACCLISFRMHVLQIAEWHIASSLSDLKLVSTKVLIGHHGGEGQNELSDTVLCTRQAGWSLNVVSVVSLCFSQMIKKLHLLHEPACNAQTSELICIIHRNPFKIDFFFCS